VKKINTKKSSRLTRTITKIKSIKPKKSWKLLTEDRKKFIMKNLVRSAFNMVLGGIKRAKRTAISTTFNKIQQRIYDSLSELSVPNLPENYLTKNRNLEETVLQGKSQSIIMEKALVSQSRALDEETKRLNKLKEDIEKAEKNTR